MKFLMNLIIFFILNLFIFISFDKINLFKFIVDNPDNFRKFHKKNFSGWYNSIYKYFFLFCNFKF